MANYAPIIVLVYNRFDHFKRCISSLQANSLSSESIIYIVSDAASRVEDEAAVNKIREYALSISGFRKNKYLFRQTNLGAHDSCNEAIKEVLSEHDTFIILEDDVLVSPDFLQYLNGGLVYYKDDDRVFAICGFKIPFQLPKGYDKNVYFYPALSPWGFATWKERWEAVNFGYENRYSELKKNKERYREFLSIGFYIKGILQADSKKKIVAGDLRIYYHMFQNQMCAIFPVVSKSQNWGFDGTGLHCGNQKVWWTKPELKSKNKPITFSSFSGYDEILLRNHRKFVDKINGGFLAKHLKYTWIYNLYKLIKERLK